MSLHRGRPHDCGVVDEKVSFSRMSLFLFAQAAMEVLWRQEKPNPGSLALVSNVPNGANPLLRLRAGKSRPRGLLPPCRSGGNAVG
jgi:hypothetical protein